MSHVTHRKYGTYLERDTSLDGTMTPLYVHITKRATREVQTAFGDWRRSPTPVAQDPRTLLLCYCPSKSMALSEVLTDNKAQLLSDDNLYNVIDRCSNSSIVASKDCPSVCVPSQAAQALLCELDSDKTMRLRSSCWLPSRPVMVCCGVGACSGIVLEHVVA